MDTLKMYDYIYKKVNIGIKNKTGKRTVYHSGILEDVTVDSIRLVKDKEVLIISADMISTFSVEN